MGGEISMSELLRAQRENFTGTNILSGDTNVYPNTTGGNMQIPYPSYPWHQEQDCPHCGRKSPASLNPWQQAPYWLPGLGALNGASGLNVQASFSVEVH